MKLLMDLHGGEIEWAISERYDIPISKITSFANTVSPFIPDRISRLTEKFGQLYLYPAHDLTKLKSLIANHENVDGPTNVIVGSGSTEIIYLLAQYLGKGEVILPVPTYSEYEAAVTLYGGKPVFVPSVDRDTFELDTEQIISLVNTRTKAIIICNPNNPTGKLFRKADLERLAEIAKKNSFLLIVDQAYLCFTPQPRYYSMTEFVDTYPVLVLDSLSKLFGVPSLRLGWGIASQGTIRGLEKFKIPHTVGNLSVWAAEDLLPDKKFQDKIKLQTELQSQVFSQNLRKIKGLDVLQTDANFFLLRIGRVEITSTEVFERLAVLGIIVRDCALMRGLGNKFIRVTTRSAKDNLLLVESLRHIFEKEEQPETFATQLPMEEQWRPRKYK
jgi:threonine-phosphate decarboxylase